mmetsp:Transcript_2782/g.6605  ORF Transcript_2782/g.6605 Transcript_2782/m.6605 type:complete len:200 (-) Transcript_2782:246-845(-)
MPSLRLGSFGTGLAQSASGRPRRGEWRSKTALAPGDRRSSVSACARRVGVPSLGQRFGELPIPHFRLDPDRDGMERTLGQGDGLSSSKPRRLGGVLVKVSRSRPLSLLGLENCIDTFSLPWPAASFSLLFCWSALAASTAARRRASRALLGLVSSTGVGAGTMADFGMAGDSGTREASAKDCQYTASAATSRNCRCRSS